MSTSAFLLISVMLFFTTVCTVYMFYLRKRQTLVRIQPVEYAKLITSGILAFISDTIGVGSFAANVALAKVFNTFQDEELPAVCNGAQVIPGAIEAIFFLKVVDVDWVTLLTLVGGTCLGGLIGGFLVAKLSRQAIRLTMLICFIGIVGLLVADRFHVLPLTGNLLALRGFPLYIGFAGTVVCGILTSAGVGLFVLIQSLLFLLNVSPLLAFPIMTTAGAMQQPLTTLVFLKQGKIPIQKTVIIGLAGCIGVFLALPIVANLSTSCLRMLLLGIVIYNICAIGRSYFKQRKTSRVARLVETATPT